MPDVRAGPKMSCLQFWEFTGIYAIPTATQRVASKRGACPASDPTPAPARRSQQPEGVSPEGAGDEPPGLRAGIWAHPKQSENPASRLAKADTTCERSAKPNRGRPPTCPGQTPTLPTAWAVAGQDIEAEKRPRSWALSNTESRSS
jgi:hypothetical protein